MKKIYLFIKELEGLEPISKRLLLVGGWAALFCAALGGGLLAFAHLLFPDAETASYWIAQLLRASICSFAGCSIPVFLYEVLLMRMDLKQKDRENEKK